MTEKKSAIDQEVEDYLKAQHNSTPEGMPDTSNIYSFPQDANLSRSQTSFEKHPEAALLGAGAGLLGAYKGVSPSLIKPSESLFKPSEVDVSKLENILSKTLELPIAHTTETEHLAQSGREQRPEVSGRRMEATHNEESNRRAKVQKASEGVHGVAGTLNDPIVNAGPMVTSAGGISVPKSAHLQMEEEKHALQEKLRQQQINQSAVDKIALQQASERYIQQLAEAQRRAKLIGAAKGVAKLGSGAIGGALAAPQLYEVGSQIAQHGREAATPDNAITGMSGLGALMMALGGGKAGAAGALMQIPYAIKNREAITRGLTHSDINPSAFMGMPEENVPAFTQYQSKP
jgi:hypothetical protein